MNTENETTLIEGTLDVNKDLNVGGEANFNQQVIIEKDLEVKGLIKSFGSYTPNKGLFGTVEELRNVYPKATIGDYAIIGDSIPGEVYKFTAAGWVPTGQTGGGEYVNLYEYVKKKDIENKTIEIFSGSFSSLDSYNTHDRCDVYKVIGGNENGGILIVAQLSKTEEQTSIPIVQFLIGPFYINPESGTLDGKMGAVPNDIKPNIVCRKYVNGEWSKWQYYQETFLSNDGSGTNTLVAPTLKYLIELYYTKTEINDNFIKKDSVNAVRDISINQLSDLDTYTPHTKSGVYNVLMFGGTKHVGVLYVYNFQAPHHGGLQVFLSTFNYNNPGQSSLTMPSIIYRMFDLADGERWEPWKPYQTTFISQDGSIPKNGGAIGLNETNMAPSLSFLFKKTDYPKVVEWSGIVEEDAEIEDAGTVLEGQIVYISSKNTFAYKVELPYEGGTAYYAYFDGLEKFQNKRYDSSPDFVADFTKNIFKGADDSIWIADSASSIKMVNIKDAPRDGKTYGRANGEWIQVESAGTVTIDAELNETSTNPVQNAAITKGINEAKEVILLPGNLDEITTVLSETQIKAILGEATVLSANKTKKVFRDASGNIVTNIAVNSSVTPYMNDCAITYVSQNTIKKIVAEYNLSTNAWNRVREIVIDSSVSLHPGDIVLPDKTTMTLESYKASGRTDAIGVVFDSRKGLFVRKNKYTGVLIGNQDRATNIFYNVVRCKDPYDGKVTQKMSLLNSLYWSSDFPVFSYAEENGLYVASNGELAQMHTLTDSLDAIGSDYGGIANIASCTQVPLATTVSVFYGGAWEDRDTRDPLTSLSFFLIDIL